MTWCTTLRTRPLRKSLTAFVRRRAPQNFPVDEGALDDFELSEVEARLEHNEIGLARVVVDDREAFIDLTIHSQLKVAREVPATTHASAENAVTIDGSDLERSPVDNDIESATSDVTEFGDLDPSERRRRLEARLTAASGQEECVFLIVPGATNIAAAGAVDREFGHIFSFLRFWAEHGLTEGREAF